MRHLLIISLVLLVAAPAHAQHLGARVQWQPNISDTDARLLQPVEIEILGRAAVPALKLLSDATSVALTVAPEDLTTVGERKLTVISKGLSLKAIMVQLPEALQECHWDIDPSGDEPVYLLHRNAGVKQTMEWLSEREAARQAEKQRSERANRMEEVKRALGGSALRLSVAGAARGHHHPRRPRLLRHDLRPAPAGHRASCRAPGPPPAGGGVSGNLPPH